LTPKPGLMIPDCQYKLHQAFQAVVITVRLMESVLDCQYEYSTYIQL